MISLNAVIAPLKWIYSLLVDQTSISIVGPEGFNGSTEALLVREQGGHRGEFRFGIVTDSRKPVEITRLEVAYAAPLQLHDPEHRGFFDTEITPDSERPFRIFWVGSVTTCTGVIQMFALIASFPDGCLEHQVAISVHARRRHSPVGGFLSYGRTHLTVVHRSLRLISEPLRGFALRPGWFATSPQPFIIEHSLTVSGPGQSLIVHEVLKDGTVSSREMKLPET